MMYTMGGINTFKHAKANMIHTIIHVLIFSIWAVIHSVTYILMWNAICCIVVGPPTPDFLANVANASKVFFSAVLTPPEA